MMDPARDRIDYGDRLRPPDGFTLDAAVGTTYTLDLQALMLLPLAMEVGSTLEEVPTGEQLLLLPALKSLRPKLRLFVQQGNLHVPREFNRLFTLLEPMVIPVGMDSPYSSFHPKVWLLRFTGNDEEVRYRLLVMSRNLTLDRSWDMAVVLEGEYHPRRKRSVSRSRYTALYDLIRWLKKTDTGEFEPQLALFQAELPKVVWQMPAPFEDMEMLLSLPGDHGLGELSRPKCTSSIAIVSPFLHEKALSAWSNIPADQRWLFSRADELDRITKQAVPGWQCHHLNDQLVDVQDSDGGETPRFAPPSGLHAKLFVTTEDSRHYWYLGSANATRAALGMEKGQDGNVEFVIRFRVPENAEALSPKSFAASMCGDDDTPGLFESHQFQPTSEEESDRKEQQRKLMHSLAGCPYELKASPGEGNRYECCLYIPGEVSDGYGGDYSVDYRMLGEEECSFRESVPGETIKWSNIPITRISAFLVIRVRFSDGTAQQLMVRAKLEFPEGADPREAQLTRELVSDHRQFMELVGIMLSSDHEKLRWLERSVMKPGGTQSSVIDSLFDDGTIYESLLKCAARDPLRLRQIETLVRELSEEDHDRIPKTFRRLWCSYSRFLESMDQASGGERDKE